MNKTKVVIIDEQEIFRAGVRRILSARVGFEISDCSPSIDLLRFVETIVPDLILLGNRLNNHISLEFSKQVAYYLPNTRVIFLSPDPDDEELFDIIKLSTIACVNKSATSEELVAAIRKASADECRVNDTSMTGPSLTYSEVNRNFKQIKNKSTENHNEKVKKGDILTSREVEILSYIADGNTNKQIASALQVSEQTIKNHIRNILYRSNAYDRAHAVTIAIRNGWISVGVGQAG